MAATFGGHIYIEGIMKLDKLREIAMAARQGQWETRVVESWNSDDPYALSAVARTHRQSPRQGEQRDKANADADHIATFSPEMVLKLLDCVRALEFYADEDDVWGACQPEDTFETCCHIVAETRGGDRAREALAALKGTK